MFKIQNFVNLESTLFTNDETVANVSELALGALYIAVYINYARFIENLVENILYGLAPYPIRICRIFVGSNRYYLSFRLVNTFPNLISNTNILGDISEFEPLLLILLIFLIYPSDN